MRAERRAGGGGGTSPQAGASRTAPAQRVEITSIAAGGAGVGRLADGRAVFVHRTGPGDTVRVRVTDQRKRWARAELVSIEKGSDDRRVAPCPYYDRCGGCTLEHLMYPAQLRAKGRLVLDALQRIGGLSAAEPGVVPSPREFGYRNRVSFTLRRSRAGQVHAGFHELNRPGRILDMTGECLLPEPAIARVWDALRGAWGGGAFRLPSGETLRLTLRANLAGEVALLVQGGFAPGRPAELVELVSDLMAIWHEPEGTASTTLLAGSPILNERWGGERVPLAADAFVQVNRGAAALMEDHLAGRVRARQPEHVVDAYCGVGLLARRLAREGMAVIGIEANAKAVDAARHDAPAGADFLAATVEAALPGALPADLVILNPPRSGLGPPVIDTLIATPPPTLLYVSCDPATLARDLRRLAPVFAVEAVRSFDLFPQTSHVETIVELSCAIT